MRKIMECVKTLTFSFVINGEPVRKIMGWLGEKDYGYGSNFEGLRQGDLISPYLSLLCADVLSNMLVKAANQGLIQGYKVCVDAPPVSHLFFLQTILLFSAKWRNNKLVR